jgi:methyltransferase-like protein 6
MFSSSGKKVLELGVGNGKTLLSILKQKPKSVEAIDFSQEAIKICKNNSNFKSVNLTKGNVLHMPYESASFDVVVCYYILNNLIQKDRLKAVKEMKRVLKKQGLILFEDFALGDFRDKKGKLVEKGTYSKNNGRICHYFSLTELKSLFKDFNTKNIIKREFRIIKNQPNLTRKIISGTFTIK